MSTRGRAHLPARRPLDLQTGIVRAESLIYLVIGLLLVAAAALTLIGTIADVIEGSRSRPVTDVGVFLLERILLIFIIAELLYTLRLVDFGGKILVEPFLFIGLIADGRRVLVITAEFEGGRAQASDFVRQIGARAGLALAFTLAIYLLRGTDKRD